MSDEVVIRPMRADDLTAVLEIERQTFTMAWSRDTFRGLLEQAETDPVALYVDRTLAGYAVAWSVGEQAELGNLAIAAAERGRGLGSRLLAVMLERMAGRGIGEVFLEVRESNQRAQNFYAAHGFRELGRRPRYYKEPVEDAIMMGRQTHGFIS